MFYIIEKRDSEKFKMHFFAEIVEMLENLNEILSKVYMDEGYKSYYNDHPGFENYVHKGTLFLSWSYLRSNDSCNDASKHVFYAIGYLTNYDILANNEDLSEKMEEFKDMFKEHMDLLLISKSQLNNQNILNPKILLDMMFKKCLTDPYTLIKFVGLNEDHMYQTFVLYLNKTIEHSPTIANTDLIEIRDNFFKNCSMPDKDLKKYDSLLLFYLKNKKIETFSVKYTQFSLDN